MLMPSVARPRRRPRSAAAPADGPSRGRRGRPMKRASELRPSRKARTEYSKLLHEQASAALVASSKSKDSRRQLSRLEALPVELIQLIFFYSLELNMPRASPQLALVLSKPSIYHALVLFAYFDSLNDESPVETQHFRPAEYRRISLDERMRLQREILACRWFTLSLLKSCMPTLSRLQMAQAWHHEHRAETALSVKILSKKDSALPAHVAPNQELQSASALPAPDDELGMQKHFLATLEQQQQQQQSTVLSLAGLARHADEQEHQHQHQQPTRPTPSVLGPAGDEKTLPRIIQWTSSVDANGHLHKTVHQGITILAARVLPDHIVRGSPWTASKLELLQLLRQGMRFVAVDRVLDISAAALFEGMASAIREGNERVLLVLLELHYATMRLHPTHDPDQFDAATLLPLPLPRGRRCLVAPFAHPLPVELFHLAVRQKYTTHPHHVEAERDREHATARHLHSQRHEHEHEHESESDTSPPRSSSSSSSSAARMLTLLLREGVDSIGLDDPILTRWAMYTWTHQHHHHHHHHHHSTQSPDSPDSLDRRLSRWLLDYMSHTDDYGLPRGEPLFVNGKLSPRRREGEYPFPDMSFTDEIGYLFQSAPADVVRAPDGGPCG